MNNYELRVGAKRRLASSILKFFRISIFFVLFSIVFSQSWYNHSELNWQTIETDHFIIHFHNDSERSAREASIVAEHIYGPITAVYQFEPDSKTHIIIKDVNDSSNGMAFYYDNKIEIWARPLDFDLRGSHRWIQNVITHEFTHIIQIGASMKYNRQFPGAYFQMMGYEKEKRKDVLYGYPNVIISYPIPGTAVPPWLAEGTAQYMYPGANFDFWDTNRDMILRDRVLNDNLLTFSEMNSFGKRGIGNESIYNQGFAFVSYLAERFGIGVLSKISESLAKPFNYSVRKAMKDATGIDGQVLYDEWKLYLMKKYMCAMCGVIDDQTTGIILEDTGTTNVHPVWSPNESQFAFLSNKDNDYFSQTDLFIYSFDDSSSKKIMGGVQTAPTWLNDSTLIYSKKSKPNKNGSKYYDLYKLDLIEEEEERLTTDARLTSPVFNKKLNLIASITSYDGTSNIMVSDADSIDFNPITNLNNGLQMFSLSWKDENILVDAVDNHGRQIYQLDISNGDIKTIIDEYWDTRDVVSSQNQLVNSDDKSGIFNLYLSGKGYITNVTGGAFMPDVSEAGKILYSLYENGRYRIALVENFEIINEKYVGYSSEFWQSIPNSELITEQNKSEAKPYKDTMSKPFVLPRVMFDYGTVKFGAYVYATDVLDKLFVFGGASINTLKDKDLFLMFEFKKLKPTFYTNIYGIQRNIYDMRTELDGYGSGSQQISDISFTLFASDIGFRFPIKSHKIHLEYSYQNYHQTVYINKIADLTVHQPGFGFDYYRGHSLKIKGKYRARKPEYAGNMLPSNGYELDYQFSYENNQFMEGLNFDEGTIRTEFAPNHTYRLEIDAEKHFTFNHANKIVASISSQIGVISNPEIDDFFHYFGGGLPGIKGYTYFDSTLTGPYKVIGTGVVRFPLFKEKSISVAHLNFQNLSVGVIGQAGGAFSGKLRNYIDSRDFKSSAGVELRLSGFSFYAYPTAITYEYHQAITDLDENGKHYFTLLFDF
ncbi:MAG: hypothetical protein ISR90_01120 [Candidatus Marinimicrobia bacterium]|nr:hypothetical protein [Candidatus Neomarinimicrobiota bacterium]MBL7022645.1 hypothetical protein [Candidatus Neomarinimicrobiota bacterium]